MAVDDHLAALASPIAPPDEQTADEFPCLYNLSAAFWWRSLPVPRELPPPPEYVHVPLGDFRFNDENATKTWLWITEWNLAWEAGPLRFGMFDSDEVPAELRWLARHADADLRLVPNLHEHPYAAYSSLYHLLPLSTVKRFRLPALKRGIWPVMASPWEQGMREELPPDFQARLSQAFAFHIWPHLLRTKPSSFGHDDPVTILAHSLDFWLPYVDVVAQERMKALGRVAVKDEEHQRKLDEINQRNDPKFVAERPLFGGDVWRGEAEAREATEDLVEIADEHGKLRSIIEAVRCHRVRDDFSAKWSFAKEDFERKLFKKRSKVKVTFVELDDTIPVHGPDAEVEANLLWQNLFGLLDRRERHVLVCLRSGHTRVGDIAAELGYANHSPVSKALTRIRQRARKLLDG